MAPGRTDSRVEGALSGARIYILVHGWTRLEVLRTLAYIRDHGGITVKDPLARSVTHALVRTPNGTREEQNLTYPVEPLGLPNNVEGWTFDHVVAAFTPDGGRACVDDHGNARHVAVVQIPWLRACVDAGRMLETNDNYGGWLVRGVEATERRQPLPKDPRLQARIKPTSPSRRSVSPRRPIAKRDSWYPEPHDTRDDREVRDNREPIIDLRGVCPSWSEYYSDDRRPERPDRGGPRGRSPPPRSPTRNWENPRPNRGWGRRDSSPRDGLRFGARRSSAASSSTVGHPAAASSSTALASGNGNASGMGGDSGPSMTLRQRLNRDMFTGKSLGQVDTPESNNLAEHSERRDDATSERRDRQSSHTDAPLPFPPQSEPTSRSTPPPTAQSVSLADLFPPSHSASPSLADRLGLDTSALARELLSRTVEDYVAAREDLLRPSTSAAPTSAKAPPPTPPNLAPATPQEAIEAGNEQPTFTQAPSLALAQNPPSANEAGAGATALALPSPSSLHPLSLPPPPPPMSAKRKKKVALQIVAVKTEPVDIEHNLPPPPSQTPVEQFSSAQSPPQQQPRPSSQTRPNHPNSSWRPAAADDTWPQRPPPPSSTPTHLNSSFQSIKPNNTGEGAAPRELPFSGTLSAAPSPTPRPSGPLPQGDVLVPLGAAPPPSRPLAEPAAPFQPPPPPLRIMSTTVSPTAPEPAPVASSSKLTGVFADHQRLPLDFYVEENDEGEGEALKRLIASQGGGTLAPASEARFVILHLNKDTPATERRHQDLVAKKGVHPCSLVLSRTWVIDCILIKCRLIDPIAYLVPASTTVADPAEQARCRAPASAAPRRSKSRSVDVPLSRKRARHDASAHASPAAPAPASVSSESEYDDSDDTSDDDGTDIPLTGVTDHQARNVLALIEKLKAWDGRGGKMVFIQSAGIPNSINLYKRHKAFIDPRVPGLLAHSRPGRKRKQ